MARLRTIARRTFLIGSAAVAGGLVIGYWKFRQPYENPLARDSSGDVFALTPYVRIDQAGITIITPRAEMGQGIHTTLAALVAEELDVSLDQVSVEHGPASKAYFNAAVMEEGLPFPATDTRWFVEQGRGLMQIPAKFLGLQLTGGSSSIADAYMKMRKAGAAARSVLVEAAAQELGVPAAKLSAEKGFVLSGDGVRLAYTELAPLAAVLELPDDPPLKPPSEWQLLGRTQPRVDMVGKCTGTSQYSMDVRLPGMLYATVKMNPRLGGPMHGYDAAIAETLPGVKQILPLDGGVAVVATNTWYAFKAAEAISFEWGAAAFPESTEAHFALVEHAFEGEPDSQLRDDGDVTSALSGDGVIEGTYRVPYLAHAAMEPLNAAALFKEGRLDVWAGNQLPTQVVIEGAAIAGIAEEQVYVHTTMMGGAFGRRGEMDFIKNAVQVAIELEGTPVKLTWSREEDMCHDTYRPLAIARYRAKHAEGKLAGLDMSIAAPSVVASQLGRLGASVPGSDKTIVQAAWDQPYNIPDYRVTGYRAPALLPVGYWRSVGASQNGFFHESAIDEVAHAAGVDPMEMRLSLIDDEPSKRVLEAVAEMSNWGSVLPQGHARGVAFVLSFGVPAAEVIEVAITGSGVKLVRAYAAVDVGIALDPGNIEAQVQSGLNFGLAAAMSAEITLRDGVVQQTNFHNYDALRMYQTPPIEVRVLEHGEKIRGIGEPATPPAAPALANAIFAATGKRLREMPFNKHVRFA